MKNEPSAGETEEGRIFINYRRGDTAWATTNLSDRLENAESNKALNAKPLRDIDDIPPGFDFRDWIEREVTKSDVMVTLIGPQWLDALLSRLQDPADYVRIEIELAIVNGIFIIPILVDGAVMPQEAELPDAIRGLASRQSLYLSQEHLSADTNRLIKAIPDAIKETRREREKRKQYRSHDHKEDRQEKNREERHPWGSAGRYLIWLRTLPVSEKPGAYRGIEAVWLLFLVAFCVIIAPSLFATKISMWVTKYSIYNYSIGSIPAMLSIIIWYSKTKVHTGYGFAIYMKFCAVPLSYMIASTLCITDAVFISSGRYAWNGLIGSVIVTLIYVMLYFTRYEGNEIITSYKYVAVETGEYITYTNGKRQPVVASSLQLEKDAFNVAIQMPITLSVLHVITLLSNSIWP